MIIRDPWNQETGPYYGGGLAGFPNTDPRYWLEQLHALALSIYQAQQRAEAAKARGDTGTAMAEVQNVRNLRDTFVQVRQRFLEVAEQVDPTGLGAVDRVVLATGQWIERFLTALPGAIAALPKAVLSAAGDIGASAGVQAFKVSLPLVATGVVLLWFLMRAEKSRTVRYALAR